MLKSLFATLLLMVVSGSILACSLVPPRPGTYSLNDRLSAFPKRGALTRPVEVRWSNQAIPFIEAQVDDDVPYAIGLVQAHLRLSQLELFRRAVYGRLAESGGYLAVKIDHALRTLNLPRVAPEIEARLPRETARWIERFVEGINDYKRSVTDRGADFRLLDLPEDPWTVRDVLAISRLGGIDVNWFTLLGSLSLQDDPGWPEVWSRILAHGDGARPSFGDPTTPLDMLPLISKSGSNTLVVSGSRRGTRGALIANDPHVGFALPNLWVVIGYRSPRGAVLGFMLPGIPFVLLGRNERISWGGTNMIGLGSSLYDVSSLPPEQLVARTEEIGVRWWFDVTREVRDTPWGPLVSDIPLLGTPEGKRIALKWRGHEASDELTAFLKVSRAESFAEFREAFRTYAVAGQNFLYADSEGAIGQVLALETNPGVGRVARLPIGDPSDPAHAWDQRVGSTELPAAYNPPEGYLISCNNTPVRLNPGVTITTNSNDRYNQLERLLVEGRGVSVDSVRSSVQLDTYAESHHHLAMVLADRLPTGGSGLGDAIRSWDGRYDEMSRGALALHLLAYHLTDEWYGSRMSEPLVSFLRRSTGLMTFLAEDVTKPGFQAAVVRAIRSADKDFVEYSRWGDIHRLRVQHLIGQIPLLGSLYRYQSFPIGGSGTTVFKTAGSLTDEPHFSRFGANARHISDMNSPDENYFVLMGGQDGFVGSANYLDQVDRWRSGELFRVPLTSNALAEAFRRETVVAPYSEHAGL